MVSSKDLQVRGSRIHGMGVFAVRAIPANTRVLQYVGKKLSAGESDALRDKTYFVRLRDQSGLDGGAGWNPAGFVNHSCAPNCDFTSAEGALWIVTGRDLAANEELTFNYGYPLSDFLRNPCRCGARNCAGFMVAEQFFPLLRQFLENKVTARPVV